MIVLIYGILNGFDWKYFITFNFKTVYIELRFYDYSILVIFTEYYFRGQYYKRLNLIIFISMTKFVSKID